MLTLLRVPLSFEFPPVASLALTAEEFPDDVDSTFGELEADMEWLEAKRLSYDPDGMALIDLTLDVALDEVKQKTKAEFRVVLKNTWL